MKEKRKSPSAALGRGLVYAFLRIMFRPKVYYKSKAAKDALSEGNCIIVGNHVGHHDGQMFYMLFRNSVLLLAKDWADKGILKWITTGGHFIPVDRNGMDVSWISAARDEMKQGRNMIIFPEGHTSKGEMDEFKPGFAMLAVLTGAMIVPVYHDGEYHKLFGKRLRVYVGDPVELASDGKGLSADYLKQESERMQKIVQSMKDKKEK